MKASRHPHFWFLLGEKMSLVCSEHYFHMTLNFVNLLQEDRLCVTVRGTHNFEDAPRIKFFQLEVMAFCSLWFSRELAEACAVQTDIEPCRQGAEVSDLKEDHRGRHRTALRLQGCRPSYILGSSFGVATSAPDQGCWDAMASLFRVED